MIALETHQLDLRYASLRRCNPDKERRLLSSLAEIGQQMPVVVVEDELAHRYVLIDGYKRVRSLMRLSSDTVQAIIWQLSQADALMLVQLLRRSDGESPLEQGWLLLELQSRFGLSQNEIARRFAVSGSWVSRRLALVTRLPEFVQAEVSKGRIGAHAAQKYLAPLARANFEDTKALCSTIAPLKLSSRQVGTLYAGYLSADEAGRTLIVNQPDIYLRTQEEIIARDNEARPNPRDQLLRDADILMAVAKRVRSVLQTGLGASLTETEPDGLWLCLQTLRVDVEALLAALRNGPCHA